MPRFFVENDWIEGNLITIKGQDVKHIKNVLRLREGDNIIVTNRNGEEFDAKILECAKNEIITSIICKTNNSNEPKTKITLFQGLPKGEKFELIIQKNVEIGVSKIVPIITERVIVKINSSDVRKKAERWNKISEQAAKQCGRNIVPEICSPIKLDDSLKLLEDFDLVLVPYENEKNRTLKNTLNEFVSKAENIAVVIGPEGGFSEKEISLLNKYYTVSLGPRILRTETAGLCTSTIILYQMGDMECQI